MSNLIDDLSALTQDDVERIERVTMRWLFQAVIDFNVEPVVIFRNSPDSPKDVAEDVTREILDRLTGYNIQQRVFGNVDYKKARYIVMPDQMVRQALFVDSKAEKSSINARLQMSEISMRVRQYSGGHPIDLSGKISPVERFNGEQFLSTTMLVHYYYTQDAANHYALHQATLCAIPNGLLQDRYNPSADDTIWLAGPHAPKRGEEFRVRLGFKRLEKKALWRIQRVRYEGNVLAASWQE